MTAIRGNIQEPEKGHKDSDFKNSDNDGEHNEGEHKSRQKLVQSLVRKLDED